MNLNLPALSGQSVPFSPTEESATPMDAQVSGASPDRAALLGRNDRPAANSLTNFTIAKAEESSNLSAQDDLATRFRILCTNDDGNTLATLLAGMSEEKVLSWLNEPLPFSEFHDTPMMYVARHNCASIASVLLSHKANPVAPSPHSETASHPLFIAAQSNHVDVIRVMSTADAFDPDAPRGDGYNAMVAAIQFGQQEVAKVLLEYKADPNFKIRAAFRAEDLVSLQSLTADEAASANQCWYTLMNDAAMKGRANILKLLLLNGGKVANVDPDNPMQQSPLAAAIVGRGCEETIRLLLMHGANMHELMPVGPDDWAGMSQAKIQKRATLCEYICSSGNHETNPFIRLFYEYYRTSDLKKVTYEKFVKMHAVEGFCRLIATSDSVLHSMSDMLEETPDLLRKMESFLQKKATETQIELSNLDENQRKILESLVQAKQLPAVLNELEEMTPEAFQKQLLANIDFWDKKGVTQAMLFEGCRPLIEEFMQEMSS